jgi:hypothetical protein
MSKFPKVLISIDLPLEPMQHERSYCLRQISESKYATCYMNKKDNSYYYGHYFFSLEEALIEFNIELNRQTKRLSYHVEMYYKYRAEIHKLENNSGNFTQDI